MPGNVCCKFNQAHRFPGLAYSFKYTAEPIPMVLQSAGLWPRYGVMMLPRIPSCFVALGGSAKRPVHRVSRAQIHIRLPAGWKRPHPPTPVKLSTHATVYADGYAVGQDRRISGCIPVMFPVYHLYFPVSFFKILVRLTLVMEPNGKPVNSTCL